MRCTRVCKIARAVASSNLSMIFLPTLSSTQHRVLLKQQVVKSVLDENSRIESAIMRSTKSCVLQLWNCEVDIAGIVYKIKCCAHQYLTKSWTMYHPEICLWYFYQGYQVFSTAFCWSNKLTVAYLIRFPEPKWPSCVQHVVLIKEKFLI